MTTRLAIKAKAYAVLTKEGKVLMHEIKEHGKLIGYRIPGGHVEFGERAVDAVVREIKEELNAAIINVSLKTVTENIFVYQDVPGHEITFVYEAEFADKVFYTLETIQGYEHTVDHHFPLYWIDPHNPPQGLRIFPEGLSGLLKGT